MRASPAGTQGLALLAKSTTSRHSARSQERVLEELKINTLEPRTPSATAGPTSKSELGPHSLFLALP